MTYKDKDYQRQYKRIYMKHYRKVQKGAGMAKLAKLRALCEQWEKDLGQRAASSSRVLLARQLLTQVEAILEGKKRGE